MHRSIRFAFVMVTCALLVGPISGTFAEVLNVRDFGAKGDGKTDDTAAFQACIDKLTDPNIAEIHVPAGVYRIEKTIEMVALKVGRDITVRGEGKRTILQWGGEDGGTLWKSYGMGHCHFTGIEFAGCNWEDHKRRGAGKAGILFLFLSDNGRGNMINHFSDCKFTYATVGLQMGTKDGQVCNADLSFDHTFFMRLDKGFYCKNSQAVDFLFSYVFALEVGTLFDFERGGNFAVTNAQLTGVKTFLNIGGGGRCAATFTCINVRLEGASRANRDQLLTANGLFWEQALVKFIGFNDCLWQWHRNKTKTREIPLCEIGPGVNVSFESSAFNGPVAKLHGEANKPASLIVRESTFGYVLPHRAIAADRYGYFKTENCFTDHMEPVPDVVKWPRLKPLVIDADTSWEPDLPPAADSTEGAEAAYRERRDAWLKEAAVE